MICSLVISEMFFRVFSTVIAAQGRHSKGLFGLRYVLHRGLRWQRSGENR